MYINIHILKVRDMQTSASNVEQNTTIKELLHITGMLYPIK